MKEWSKYRLAFKPLILILATIFWNSGHIVCWLHSTKTHTMSQKNKFTLMCPCILNIIYLSRQWASKNIFSGLNIICFVICLFEFYPIVFLFSDIFPIHFWLFKSVIVKQKCIYKYCQDACKVCSTPSDYQVCLEGAKNKRLYIWPSPQRSTVAWSLHYIWITVDGLYISNVSSILLW